MKKVLLGVLACACTVGFTLGLAACGQAGSGTAEPPAIGQETVLDGAVLMIPDGFPADTLGEDGDVCFATENGDFFRKENGAWSLSSIEHYDILENDVLSVTFGNGQSGKYKMTTLNEGSSCDHAGLAEAETHVVYESFCVVPGIGVKYCDECGSSFAVILPANPEHHSIDEENFGQCRYCGKLESGGSVVVADSSNFTESLDEVQDGDVLVVDEAIEMSGETLEVDGKDITIDIAGHDLTLQNTGSDRKDGLSLENGANVTLTDSKGEGTLTLSNAGSGNNDIFLYNTDEETTTTLTLRDIDIECIYPAGLWNDRAPIYAYAEAGNAVVNVEAGTHIHANSPTGRGLSCIAAQGAEVNLDGGIFELEASRDGNIGGYTCAVEAGDGTNVNLNGGEIDLLGKGGNLCGIAAVGEGVNITMTGGTINVLSDDVPSPKLETEIVGIYADIEDYESLHIVMESGTINVATGYKKGSEGIGLAFNTFRSESENVSWVVQEDFVITVDKEKGTGNFVYNYMNRGIIDSEPNLTIPERYNTPDLIG